MDRSQQKVCSQCNQTLRRTSVLCCVCGWIHVGCSGLRSSSDYYRGFTCKKCSAEGNTNTETSTENLSPDDDRSPRLPADTQHRNEHISSQPIVALSSGSACPIASCGKLVASTMMLHHMQQHLQGVYPGEIPNNWLQEHGRFPCRCGKLVSNRMRNAHVAQCTVSQPTIEGNILPDPTVANLPTLDEIFKLKRATLKHIPKSARQAFGTSLYHCLCNVISDNTVEAWTKLLMLPKCVLPSNRRGGKNQKQTPIDNLCTRWDRGEWWTLWNQAKSVTEVKKTNVDRGNKQEQVQRDAAIAAAREGHYGKACRILTSSGIAENNQNTWEKLRAKHPQAEPPNASPGVTEPIQLKPNFDLAHALRSFPKDTACGPSGLRVQHLLEALEATVPVTLTSQLRHVCNILLAGTAPTEVAPFLAGATLTALKKGDNDIRPIASGEVLRRLASKCACFRLRSKCAEYFAPFQFGVACPKGTERIVHRLRQVIDAHWDDDDFVVFKVDMSNAFNTISRNLILSECSANFPEILNWAKYCYGQPPKLFHTMGVLSSECGVQQGDPIGPLLFALALNTTVETINEKCDLSFHAWYLDDGVFCGTGAEIRKLIGVLRSVVELSGLSVNLNKCELYSKVDLSSFPSEITKRNNEPNLEILGAPIGDPEFCENFIKKKGSNAEGLLHQLSKLHDPQIAINLLRSCGSHCKLGHLSRSTPPTVASTALGEYDKKVRLCFDECAAVNTTDTAWHQAQLPARLGGLGFRSLEAHASASYLSSVSCALSDEENLINAHTHAAMEIYNSKVTETKRLSISYIPESQKRLSSSIDEVQATKLKSAASIAQKARLESISASHCAEWTRAIPSEALGLSFTPMEYQVLVKWWLGLDIFGENEKCPRCPNELLDQHCQHALTCKYGPDVCRRHNLIRNCFADYCRRAHLNPILEAGSGFGDQSRPADVLIPAWSLGRDAALDFTVVNPLNSNNILGAITHPGSIVELSAERKHQNNDEKCQELGWKCVPVVVSTYGEWGREAKSFIDRLSNQLAIQTGSLEREVKHAIYTRVNCNLMRSNAQAILSRGRCPLGRSELTSGGDPMERHQLPNSTSHL